MTSYHITFTLTRGTDCVLYVDLTIISPTNIKQPPLNFNTSIELNSSGKLYLNNSLKP